MTVTADTTSTRAQQQAAHRAAYANGLRALADLLDAMPDIPIGETSSATTITPWFPETRDQLASIMRAARAAGATVERHPDDELFQVHIPFGPITAKALAWRDDVCERVVVGTREIVEMVPDPKAPAPPMVELKRTEEVVEYRCPDGRPTPGPVEKAEAQR